MTTIAPARFQAAMLAALDGMAKAPLSLSVFRRVMPGGAAIVGIVWDDPRGKQHRLERPEAEVIKREPTGMVDLVMASPRRRKEMLEA